MCLKYARESLEILLKLSVNADFMLSRYVFFHTEQLVNLQRVCKQHSNVSCHSILRRYQRTKLHNLIMPLNVSREEVFTSYEHEVQKLRRLGKELRLTDIDVDEIIHHSFHLLQGHHMKTENVKSSSDKIPTKSVRSFYSFQLIVKIIVIVFLTLIVACFFITYHKPTYNLVVRNVQELIYPIMKCLRRMTLPVVRALPSVTGKFNA